MAEVVPIGGWFGAKSWNEPRHHVRLGFHAAATSLCLAKLRRRIFMRVVFQLPSGTDQNGSPVWDMAWLREEKWLAHHSPIKPEEFSGTDIKSITSVAGHNTAQGFACAMEITSWRILFELDIVHKEIAWRVQKKYEEKRLKTADGDHGLLFIIPRSHLGTHYGVDPTEGCLLWLKFIGGIPVLTARHPVFHGRLTPIKGVDVYHFNAANGTVHYFDEHGTSKTLLDAADGIFQLPAELVKFVPTKFIGDVTTTWQIYRRADAILNIAVDILVAWIEQVHLSLLSVFQVQGIPPAEVIPLTRSMVDRMELNVRWNLFEFVASWWVYFNSRMGNSIDVMFYSQGKPSQSRTSHQSHFRGIQCPGDGCADESRCRPSTDDDADARQRSPHRLRLPRGSLPRP